MSAPSKVIRVDAEVRAHIEKNGKMGDTPNAVLRRLLGIDDGAEKRGKK